MGTQLHPWVARLAATLERAPEVEARALRVALPDAEDPRELRALAGSLAVLAWRLERRGLHAAAHELALAARRAAAALARLEAERASLAALRPRARAPATAGAPAWQLAGVQTLRRRA